MLRSPVTMVNKPEASNFSLRLDSILVPSLLTSSGPSHLIHYNLLSMATKCEAYSSLGIMQDM